MPMQGKFDWGNKLIFPARRLALSFIPPKPLLTFSLFPTHIPFISYILTSVLFTSLKNESIFFLRAGTFHASFEGTDLDPRTRPAT